MSSEGADTELVHLDLVIVSKEQCRAMEGREKGDAYVSSEFCGKRQKGALAGGLFMLDGQATSLIHDYPARQACGYTGMLHV